MDQAQPARTFTTPVALLLAGVLLAMLALMWTLLGTTPFMNDDPTAPAAESNPWLPVCAGLLAIAALWAGIRALARPAA